MVSRMPKAHLVHEVLIDPAFRAEDYNVHLLLRHTICSDPLFEIYTPRTLKSILYGMIKKPTCCVTFYHIFNTINQSIEESGTHILSTALLSQILASFEADADADADDNADDDDMTADDEGYSKRVSEVLNLSAMRERIYNGSYTWQHLNYGMQKLFQVLWGDNYPPCLDEWRSVLKAFDEQRSDSAVEQSIRNVLHCIAHHIHMTRVKYVNCKIQEEIMKEFKREEAIQIEVEHFNKQLQDGEMKLEKTIAWMHDAQRRGVLQNAELKTIHMEAMLSLLFRPRNLRPDLCPETLLLDGRRLLLLQKETKYLVNAISILVNALHVEPFILMKETMERLLSSENNKSIFDVNGGLMSQMSEESKKLLFSSLQPCDPIHKVLFYCYYEIIVQEKQRK